MSVAPGLVSRAVPGDNNATKLILTWRTFLRNIVSFHPPPAPRVYRTKTVRAQKTPKTTRARATATCWSLIRAVGRVHTEPRRHVRMSRPLSIYACFFYYYRAKKRGPPPNHIGRIRYSVYIMVAYQSRATETNSTASPYSTLLACNGGLFLSHRPRFRRHLRGNDCADVFG